MKHINKTTTGLKITAKFDRSGGIKFEISSLHLQKYCKCQEPIKK